MIGYVEVEKTTKFPEERLDFSADTDAEQRLHAILARPVWLAEPRRAECQHDFSTIRVDPPELDLKANSAGRGHA